MLPACPVLRPVEYALTHAEYAAVQQNKKKTNILTLCWHGSEDAPGGAGRFILVISGGLGRGTISGIGWGVVAV